MTSRPSVGSKSDPRTFHWVGRTGLAVYCAVGLIGAFCISDEFDSARVLFYAFCAVPVAVAHLSATILYPLWDKRFPRVWGYSIAVQITAFAWGHFLLLNAVGEGQESVVVATKVSDYANMDLTQQRGALGHLYRWRM